MYDLAAFAGIIIACFIVWDEVKSIRKKRRHKIKEIEVGEWAGFKDFYNCTPYDIIVLENSIVVNERIDCEHY